jgi:hypothetical protein
MTGQNISVLPAVFDAELEDLVAAVQDDVTVRLTLNQILSLVYDTAVCKVATTGALTATYNNGTSGVGATLVNAGALAALSIDGISLSVGDRVLVKNQASQFQNGTYEVTVSGSGAVAWILTRTADYDSSSEIVAGDIFTIQFGTTNSKTQWIQTQTITTVGTDNIVFESNVVAGTGITKTNNTLSITSPISPTLGGTGVNNGSNTFTIGGNFTLSGAFTFAGTLSNNTAIIFPTTGTLQQKENIVSNSTSDIGGAGAGPISVVVSGLTASSKIVATIASSTNSVSVVKCVATATGFDVTFSGDPGASCILNYVAFIVAQ